MQSKNGKEANNMADKLLSQIQKCIEQQTKTQTVVKSAVVTNVDKSGYVSVYIPPESSVIFSGIPNQTPFNLAAGDGVELSLKNGSYTNCWITAKHGASFSGSVGTIDLDKIY